MAKEDSGASARGFEGGTVSSPSGNERGDVGGDEWGSREEGENDDARMHCEVAGIFGELGKNMHPRRVFIGDMVGLARVQSIVKCQPITK